MKEIIEIASEPLFHAETQERSLCCQDELIGKLPIPARYGQILPGGFSIVLLLVRYGELRNLRQGTWTNAAWQGL